MIVWIIFSIVAVCVLLYCKFGKSIGHIPDFRKPFSVIVLVVYAIIMLVCCSCRTQYVPVEKVKTVYRYIDRIQHDSIYQHDSINMWRNGDTVYKDRYKYLYKYLYINKVDSFFKTDSIQVPYPVEKKLTKWQAMKMKLGGCAFGGLLLALIIVGWLVFKKRNK